VRKYQCAIALAALFSTLALADSWTGRLVDADCMAHEKAGARCAPTHSSEAFALVLGGEIVKLDRGGNAKAAEALKDNDERMRSTVEAVCATVTGTQSGDRIKTERVEIQ
jgi:hypothetical protein